MLIIHSICHMESRPGPGIVFLVMSLCYQVWPFHQKMKSLRPCASRNYELYLFIIVFIVLKPNPIKWSGYGSNRLTWVDPGKKKKQFLCFWCLITRIIGGSEFAIATCYPSCPVRHMSDYYRIFTRYYPSCYKIWQYINLSSRSWEEGRMTPFLYNWHRRCTSTLLFLLSYTTSTSQPIDFKDLLILYLISNIYF
jgi:hypothetical protein